MPRFEEKQGEGKNPDVQVEVGPFVLPTEPVTMLALVRFFIRALMVFVGLYVIPCIILIVTVIIWLAPLSLKAQVFVIGCVLIGVASLEFLVYAMFLAVQKLRRFSNKRGSDMVTGKTANAKSNENEAKSTVDDISGDKIGSGNPSPTGTDDQ